MAPPKNEWIIEKINRTHERRSFSCGSIDLDEYLQYHARQNDTRGLGRTYVALQRGNNQVAGYYTISAASIEFSELPDSVAQRIPRYPIPSVRLSRLAVDIKYQGQGLGKLLMMDSFKRCLMVEKTLGIYAIIVDAQDENACRFYIKYGFRKLKDEHLRLVLSFKAVKEAFKEK
jgi:ribosomal protein S18 acetylase RimI-like enzyme